MSRVGNAAASAGDSLSLAALLFGALLVWCEFGTVRAREPMLHQTSQTVSVCSQNCAECTTLKCTKCKSGFLLNNGECFVYNLEGVFCSQHCLECKEGPSCVSCKPGFELNIVNMCVEPMSKHRYSSSNFQPYNPSNYGTQWDDSNPKQSWSAPTYTEYDNTRGYGYGVHFSGIFLLPCLVVVYILRALRRSRERAVVFNSESPDEATPEVPLRSLPPPMIVAHPTESFDGSGNPSEQDTLLPGRNEVGNGAPQLESSQGATVLVIDPEGNIEVGKEEKV